MLHLLGNKMRYLIALRRPCPKKDYNLVFRLKRANRHQAGADWNSTEALLSILFKPIDLETFPQCHSRAMKHDP
jgi:hypothetical protein